MSKDISVVFKAKDQLSDAVQQMQKSVKGLDKDIKDYKTTQDKIFREKAVLKLDITQAKHELKDLTKDIQNHVSGAKKAFLEKQTALERMTSEYKQLTKAANAAAKAEDEVGRSASRNSNRSTGKELMRSLAGAGLGTMAGQAIGGFMQNTATSALGEKAGTAIGNIGADALTGAAIGSIAGPVGTAVGAAVGGLTGAIRSLTENQGRQDEFFKNEVRELHAAAINETRQDLETGSGMAAQQEVFKRNYASMTDNGIGEKLYQAVKEYGDKTPYDTTAMLQKGMEMLSYGIEKTDVTEYMRMIGDIAMGDENKFTGLSYAFSQAMNNGSLKGDDRRQMVGWGFDPLEFVAKNTGKSFAEVKNMMSEGLITSDMLVDALRTATSAGERYHNAVNAMSDTFTGLQGQLESAKNNIKIAMGEAYNETRKKGMQKEIEALTGENAAKMQEAYSMIGAYEAEMENRHQQAITNAMQRASARIQEEGLSGIEAERVMWEAKTDAEIEYKNSVEYQKKLEAEKSLVGSIQGSLSESGEYVRFGAAMADEFSKGWVGGRIAHAKSDNRSMMERLNTAFKRSALRFGTPGGFATGLPRVPYDNFPAILHEGERVLTRTEANKAQHGGNGVYVAKIADSVVIREESDIQKIAAAIVQKIKMASETMA